MGTGRTILVTGGAGYVGSILTEQLIGHGYRVVVVDNGLSCPPWPQPRPGAPLERAVRAITYVHGDVRDPAGLVPILGTVDGVVHLASIVGDPACNVAPDLAWETNYLGTVRMVEACRRAGVRRLVFASSCSNYGVQSGDAVDEWAPVNPQSTYAQTKIQAEHYLLSTRSDGLWPCILRFATVYGLSPRMRFDLAVNLMTIKAVVEGEVIVQGGDQWRPFIHVHDAAQAILRALVTSPSTSAPEIYNCGADSENYTINDLGQLIAREVAMARLSVLTGVTDRRSYRVKFERIRRELGFAPRYSVLDGIREISAAARRGMYSDFAQPQYSNYLLMKGRSQRGAEVPVPA